MARIEHIGVVSAVCNKQISVTIASSSACESCHAKGACGVSETKEKVIETTSFSENEYKIGEKVIVFISQRAGAKAALFAYIIPVIISVLVLLLLMLSKVSDALSALITLSVLIIYFVILFTFGCKIEKGIDISIEKYYTNE